jgi:hypothetical protein
VLQGVQLGDRLADRNHLPQQPHAVENTLSRRLQQQAGPHWPQLGRPLEQRDRVPRTGQQGRGGATGGTEPYNRDPQGHRGERIVFGRPASPTPARWENTMGIAELVLNLVAKHLLNKSPEGVTKDAARIAAQKAMEKGIPKIVKSMTAKHMTLGQNNNKVVIRDALFRLWRVIIPSGDLADFVRDTQDDKVIAVVEPKIQASTTLKEVVEWTMSAAIDLAL